MNITCYVYLHIYILSFIGRMSIFVVVCLGMAFVAIVRKKQNILSFEISKLQNVSPPYDKVV